MYIGILLQQMGEFELLNDTWCREKMDYLKNQGLGKESLFSLCNGFVFCFDSLRPIIKLSVM